MAFAASALLAAKPPKTRIDPDTGHRAVCLINEPNSASLYLNQNGYSADGKKMVYTSPAGIHAVDLATKATRLVVQGRARIIISGYKTQIYYIRGDVIIL